MNRDEALFADHLGTGRGVRTSRIAGAAVIAATAGAGQQYCADARWLLSRGDARVIENYKIRIEIDD